MKPRVLCKFGIKSGVDYHRIARPIRHLEENGLIEARYWHKEIGMPREDLEWATHFIFSRQPNVNASIIAVFGMLKQFGVRIIVDNDDSFNLPEWHTSKKAYDEGYRDLLVDSARLADEVWTTNETLKGELLEYNSNVYVIPNSICHTDPQWNVTKLRAKKGVRFGYMGAQHHVKDLEWSGIDLEGLEGYTTGGKAGDYEDYGSALNAKYHIDSMSPNEYGKMYGVFDVSLIPLEPTPFSACKSNLKLLEAGFSRTAAICTKTPPYGEFADCVTYVEPGEDWNEVIQSMSKRQARKKGLALNKAVQTYTMDNVNQLRLERLF